MARARTICITVICLMVIGAGVAVGLVFGLWKHEKDPDLSGSFIYSNTKESELINVNGTRVFGVKDFTGNVQSMHAVQTDTAVYMLDNDRLTQIHSTDLVLVFNYNDTISQYVVVATSDNSSYEIPSTYYTPNVTFPEFEFEYVPDDNMSDPFTGVIIELKDSLSNRLISDASLQLNYHDETNGNRSVVMINIGGGRYYALIPVIDSTVDKYFQEKNLHNTVSQQSNALIALMQAYPVADMCSKISQTMRSFCDEISQDMTTNIANALNMASKHADRIQLRPESSRNKKDQYEIEIRIPGEAIITQLLDDVYIDPTVRTVISRQITASKGRCNEQTVAGDETPDDRTISIGKGHVAINFHYETYQVEDQIDVYYTKELVFTTGCIGTNGERVKVIRLDDDQADLRVKVTPVCAGGTSTKWYYAVECPSHDLTCTDNLCYCGLQQQPSRQVKPPSFDGCGSHRTHWNYWFIHGIGNHYNFTPVCDGHDRCYGTCNTDRLTCDDTFCSGLTQSCATKWGESPNFSLCLKAAEKFCSFVKDYGSGYFANAQNEDCWCDVGLIRDRVLKTINTDDM